MISEKLFHGLLLGSSNQQTIRALKYSAKVGRANKAVTTEDMDHKFPAYVHQAVKYGGTLRVILQNWVTTHRGTPFLEYARKQAHDFADQVREARP